MYKCSQSFQRFRIDFGEHSMSQIEDMAMVPTLVKNFFSPLFNDFPVGEKQCRIEVALECFCHAHFTCFTDGGSPVKTHHVHVQFIPFRNKMRCTDTEDNDWNSHIPDTVDDLVHVRCEVMCIVRFVQCTTPGIEYLDKPRARFNLCPEIADAHISQFFHESEPRLWLIIHH